MILSIYGVHNKGLLNYNSAIKYWEFRKGGYADSRNRHGLGTEKKAKSWSVGSSVG